MSSSSYRESHLEKGADYQSSFEDLPHRAMIWNLEQRVLDGIAASLPARPLAHLDFACGTGRVLDHLQSRMARSVGLDVSPTMMAVARTRAPKAEFVLADVTAEPVLEKDRFDIITAFRFFPNAEPSLRSAVMPQLVKRLAPDGILVFNNHLNSGSSAQGLMRLARRKQPHLMTPAEVEGLAAESGLRIVGRYGLGVLPFTERHMPFPMSAVQRVEGALMHIAPLAVFAHNIIYVCRRA